MTDARTTPTQRSAPGRQAPKGSPGARAGWSDVAPAQDSGRIDVRLTAAILAVMNDEPVVAVLPPPNSTFQPDKPMAAAVPNALALESLPSEKFVPGGQGTLETGLRACVTRVTPLDIGYLEQL